MPNSFRVLLGAKVDSIYEVKLPCFASYKLDGIRARWHGAEFFSRTGKTIPNRNLQALASSLLRDSLYSGWDGELIVGPPNHHDVFRKTESLVMSINKPLPEERIRFFVFDNAGLGGSFDQRLDSLYDVSPLVVKHDQTIITNHADLEAMEARAVAEGYEGLCTRTPIGRYKNGRSTLREQLLLKIKRFKDDEARVIGFEELLHNANPATLDERGYTHRSSHAENKVRGNILGALIVDWRGHELRIGTGFTGADRQSIWRNQDKFLNRTVTFKYLSVGMKDLPRHPVFKTFRWD